MIRINLLPHREQAKKARRNQFYSLMGLVIGLGGVIVLMGYTGIQGYIHNQESKNEMLSREIAIISKDIEEIKRLKEQTAALLARKNIIENLQRDRGETVYLLSELVKQVPEGIYLKSAKQEGVLVKLSGYAQSNARVSTLMRNVEGSQWLEDPQLIKITAKTENGRRVSEFELDIKLKRAKIDEAEKKGQATGGKDKL